jgi:phosphoribosylanthranilate isomerase
MIGMTESRALTGSAELIASVAEDRRLTTAFMTWVKICGITNLEDALVAVEAGADAVGFVFYEKSPRRVSKDAAREIVSVMTSKIERIGVFVDGEDALFNETAKEVGLSGLQVHVGSQSPDNPTVSALPPGLNRYLVLPVRRFLNEDYSFDSFAVSERNEKTAECATALFLDSGTADQPGGTGRVFDWKAAIPIAGCISDAGWRLVVAGGLTPENVGEAMGILHPWGVDVSSGVEAKPGKKDPDKVRAFVKAVRDADEANSRN